VEHDCRGACVRRRRRVRFGEAHEPGHETLEVLLAKDQDVIEELSA
jgi:hypothetical protein